MRSLITSTILICSFILILQTNAQEPIHSFSRHCYGNSTTGNMSSYQNFTTNVYSLMSLLASNNPSSQPYFFNTSVGENPPRAYGSYFCRGDLTPRQCSDCVEGVTNFLSGAEITNSDCYGDGVFDNDPHCIVHYANTSTYSVYEPRRVLQVQSIGERVADPERYNETLANTMEEIIQEARFGNWTVTNFEKKVVGVIGSDQNLYVLVQCTPDISAMNCSRCLGELYLELPNCSNGTQGGYVAYGNCFMKYNNESFFGSAHHGFLPTTWHVILALITTLYFVFT